MDTFRVKLGGNLEMVSYVEVAAEDQQEAEAIVEHRLENGKIDCTVLVWAATSKDAFDDVYVDNAPVPAK